MLLSKATYSAFRLEVCTGSKLKPEPGPYPRSSDPTRAAQLNLEPEPEPKILDTSLYQSFVFVEFKRFSVDLTALFSVHVISE